MLIGFARSLRDEYALPRAAKAARRLDRRGLSDDPGIDRSVAEAMHWLCRSQDESAFRDGGSARHYSLLEGGWSPSYPETTGYIIPTMLHYASISGDASYRKRARTMLDWLVSIQLKGGAFQGGMINQTPVCPVTFNTGQILMGVAAGVQEFGSQYAESMHAAARWLVTTQDPDGAWHNNHSPYAAQNDKVYHTHTAWGLLQAAKVANDEGYAAAAMRNIEWALTHQHENGWFEQNDLTDNTQPLTHTIGYALRGVIELYLHTKRPDFLAAARRAADGILTTMGYDGTIPGRLDRHWRGTAPWVCLTGSVQIAHCWLLLYTITKDPRYLAAGRLANKYVRRTLRLDAPIDERGGIKGSFPISGEYGRFEYLNWAAKFFVDSNLFEAACVASAANGKSVTGASGEIAQIA